MSWLTLAVLSACGTPEPVAPEAPAEPAQVEPEPAAVQPRPTALVPSVLETQTVLENSGIDTKLSSLIPEHGFDLDAAQPDRAAVRTGVVLADMLLTVPNSDKAVLLKQLEILMKGMEQLDSEDDIRRKLQEMHEGVSNDTVSREELLAELDEIAGPVIRELEFNGVERIVPLIQAGSWLEGTHLVALALKGTGKSEAGEALLKQPEVVNYFMTYANEEVGEVEGVTDKLRSSLQTLDGLAKKPEPLTDEDYDAVIKVTSELMSQL